MDWYESEGIRCYGINFNRESRKMASINEYDCLNNLSAQELIDDIERRPD